MPLYSGSQGARINREQLSPPRQPRLASIGIHRGGAKVTPSGPSAAELVSSLAAKVGPAFSQGAAARGRTQLASFRVSEYPLGKPFFAGEPAVAFVRETLI